MDTLEMRYFLIFCLFLATTDLLAQPPGGRGRGEGGRMAGTISGRVLDATEKSPIQYAEVVLFSLRDSSQANGTISGEDGRFEITPVRPGRYRVDVFFLGFDTRSLADVRVNPRNREVDLGDITLSPKAIAGEEVQVEGQRASISYQIDKKVIHVDEQMTAVANSAVEVLENVPSITVDIDGNVSLRGSSNFRVLIDGRPSILDANDALQQIPATSIEDIEIITNPSARYDPEGTSGLINVVLRKNRSQTRSGLLNMNAGLNDKYGIDATYDFRGEKVSGTFGANFNNRFSDSENIRNTRTTIGGLTSFIDSEGNGNRGRVSVGGRAALSWQATSKDLFSINARLGNSSSQNDENLDYDEYSEPELVHLLSTSINDRERKGLFAGVNIGHEHQFGRKRHQLTTELQLRLYDGDEETLNELRDEASTIISGQRSTEFGPSRRLRLTMDYTQPGKGKQLLEAGYHLSYGNSEDETELYEYNPTSGVYDFQTAFNNFTDYERIIHAVYGIYGGTWNKLGYKAGLRAEYTDRTVEFQQSTVSNDRFRIDRFDLFPSTHFSYQLADGQQMMASYSRRIERPRGWFLEPFITFSDAFNVRSGNPDLEPEYIDSFEAGYQTFFGKSLASAEAYYRIGHDRIERVRTVFDENTTISRPENVGTDYALGTELMLNTDFGKKWNVNLLGNLYDYRIEGELGETAFDRQSFNWNIRFNNSFRITDAFQVQLNSRYNSATVSSQGRQEDNFSVDFSLRQTLMQRKLTATLQVRDVFGTLERESFAEGQGFYDYRFSDRESPIVMLNLRYNFNNFKQERGERGGGDEGGGDEF